VGLISPRTRSSIPARQLCCRACPRHALVAFRLRSFGRYPPTMLTKDVISVLISRVRQHPLALAAPATPKTRNFFRSQITGPVHRAPNRRSGALAAEDSGLSRWPCARFGASLSRKGSTDLAPGATASTICLQCGMASEDTTTVRVRRPDSERLQSLAKTRRTTVIEVIHEAIDALERQEFLRGLGDDYRQLRQDPANWQAFIKEGQEWDSIG